MSTGSPPPGPARVRASDAEREEYASVIRDAVGEGRLTLDEGDERLATIYASRYRDELGPLTADLPDGSPGELARGPGGPGSRSGAGNWSGHRSRRGPWPGPENGEAAAVRPGSWGPWRYRRWFIRHVAFVAFVAAALIGIWALSGAHFFWPAIPLTFLAIGLVRRFHWANSSWR